MLGDIATVSGRLVTLRPISREDYPALFKWRSSLETVHMLNFRLHPTWLDGRDEPPPATLLELARLVQEEIATTGGLSHA